MLIDTDVIIWYLRGNKKAKESLDFLDDFAISCVTYMEILQGLRNKKELKLWKAYLKNNNVRNISIDEKIVAKAIYLMEDYALSHNLRMADALIAATAQGHDLTLLSGNYTDYKFLTGLNLKKFKAR